MGGRKRWEWSVAVPVLIWWVDGSNVKAEVGRLCCLQVVWSGDDSWRRFMVPRLAWNLSVLIDLVDLVVFTAGGGVK